VLQRSVAGGPAGVPFLAFPCRAARNIMLIKGFEKITLPLEFIRVPVVRLCI
jgi:hypothetical protein